MGWKLSICSIKYGFILDEIVRTQDVSFQGFLNRMRRNETTEEDFALFMKRNSSILGTEVSNEYDSSLLICATNDDVQAENQKQVGLLPGRSAFIKAVDRGKIHPKKEKDLTQNLQLKRGARVR